MALRGVCKLVTLTAVEFTPKYTQRLEKWSTVSRLFLGFIVLKGGFESMQFLKSNQ